MQEVTEETPDEGEVMFSKIVENPTKIAVN
jgi:hypothetical protein